MEMSQGNSLYSYFKQAKKISFFFFFYKIGEQESGTGRIWGFGTSDSGEEMRKLYRTVNMVERLCAHVC
jgi:hypothetical protein